MYSKLTIVQNDLLPFLRKTLTANGVPLSLLSGVVGVKFSMREINAALRKVDDEDCSIIESGASDIGVVEYRWQVGDTDTTGMYIAKFMITYSGTPQKPLSIPGENDMFIRIKPDV